MAASCKEEREPGGGLPFAKQGSKLHAKMLSKEASAAQLAAPSFRVYYSVASAGAVPFLWESQPGTPKNDSHYSAAALPPLTPPPSYYSSGRKSGARGGGSNKRRGIFAFLRRPPGRTAPCSSSSTSWSSSSSSSSSSTMSPVFTVQSSPRRAPAAGSAFSPEADDALCFGMEPEFCERGIVKGCSVVGAVRNALATVVGGGRRA